MSHRDDCEFYEDRHRHEPCTCGHQDDLREERRATVERIRAAIMYLPLDIENEVQLDRVLAILDAEAERG